jgi:RNA polymerase sigma-70 factor, ECF subfamily
VAAGDRHALEALYERYYRRLCWYANSVLSDMDDAQDVVQDVFIRLINAPEKFDATRTFSSWVYAVTRNKCLNLIRDRNTRTRILREAVPIINDAHTTPDQPDPEHQRMEVERVVEGLKDKDRAIFRMRFDEKKSIRQIADELGAPEGTVKSSIFYLLKKITRLLKLPAHAQ